MIDRDGASHAGSAAIGTPAGSEDSLRARPNPDGEAPLALVLGGTGYVGAG